MSLDNCESHVFGNMENSQIVYTKTEGNLYKILLPCTTSNTIDKSIIYSLIQGQNNNIPNIKIMCPYLNDGMYGVFEISITPQTNTRTEIALLPQDHQHNICQTIDKAIKDIAPQHTVNVRVYESQSITGPDMEIISHIESSFGDKAKSDITDNMEISQICKRRLEYYDMLSRRLTQEKQQEANPYLRALERQEQMKVPDAICCMPKALQHQTKQTTPAEKNIKGAAHQIKQTTPVKRTIKRDNNHNIRINHIPTNKSVEKNTHPCIFFLRLVLGSTTLASLIIGINTGTMNSNHIPEKNLIILSCTSMFLLAAASLLLTFWPINKVTEPKIEVLENTIILK